jgi:hypothetical protein
MNEITLNRIDPKTFDRTRWEVIHEGRVIGFVFSQGFSVTSKSAGRRFVNSRRQSTSAEWHWEFPRPSDSKLEFRCFRSSVGSRTRKEAIEELFEAIERVARWEREEA